MYSQLLKETILEIEYDNDAKEVFADFCRLHYSEKTRIDKFERDYEQHTPVWWYTKESFIYSSVNQALRSADPQIAIQIGFFVKDLHQQIERLHNEIAKNENLRIVKECSMMNLRR